MTKNRASVFALMGLMMVALPVGDARADYIIGPQDGLQISVWQHSELDRLVTVREDGMITFPPVGDIRAAGLSTEEVATAIEEQLFAYVRGTTQVTVTVDNFLSRYVVVSGMVAQPGRYAFQTIPNIFQVIGQAGGALAGARLSEVRVVRTVEGREEMIFADVASYVATGDPTGLPELQPADLVFVPGPYGGGDVGISTPAGISILGAVARPGVYPVDQVFSLIDVVALAGGLAPGADPGKIRIISYEPGGHQVVASLDLEEILEIGEPVRYPIRVGDAIYIPARTPGPVMTIANAAFSVISLSRDLLNFIVLVDFIDNRSGGTN